MYQRTVRIAQARIGIVSNNAKLITEPRYFEGQILESLLTDIHSIERMKHSDFRYKARVNLAALDGKSDTDPFDDVCP